MSEVNKAVQYEKVECNVCLKEVPLSEAKNEEATDYVIHFCGLECYTQWTQQNRQTEN